MSGDPARITAIHERMEKFGYSLQDQEDIQFLLAALADTKAQLIQTTAALHLKIDDHGKTLLRLDAMKRQVAGFETQLAQARQEIQQLKDEKAKTLARVDGSC